MKINVATSKMLINAKHGYTKKRVIGGSGLLDTIAIFPNFNGFFAYVSFGCDGKF